MILGPAVDVAVGLIFVYLLLGLIATAAQEIIASVLKLRGKYLRDAIARLIGEGDINSDFFKSVFEHSFVHTSTATKLPSYLPSRTFALTVIDTLCDDGQAPLFTQVERSVSLLPSGTARDSLALLVQHTAGDIEALKTAVATWYDDAMDRLSGRYKRWCQNSALIIGLALAIVLNVDTIRIAKELWFDAPLRAAVVDSAQTYAGNNGNLNVGEEPALAQQMALAQQQFASNAKQLAAMDLPIGWPGVDLAKPHPLQQLWTSISLQFASPVSALLVLAGWLMTGIAVSLGAPFWFDMLKNALNMRAAGGKPPRADSVQGGTNG